MKTALTFTNVSLEYEADKRTPMSYCHDLNTLRNVIGWKAVDPTLSLSFMSAMQEFGYAPGTVRKLWRLLKRVLNWWFLRTKEPFSLEPIHLPKIPKKIRVLSDKEQEKFLNFVNEGGCEKTVWLALVLFYTGARLSEALNIRWDDIEDDVVTLRRTKTKTETKMQMPAALFKTYMKLKLFTKTSVTGGSLIIPVKEQSSVTTFFKAWLNILFNPAGTPKGERVTPHTLRHTFATRTLGEGKDMALVAYLLGHSSTEMTKRYAHIVGNQRLEDRACKLYG